MANDSRRIHERIPFALPVRISKPAAMGGIGLDLGVGGLAVHMADPVPEGSVVEVDVFGDGNTVPGTVRKSSPHAEGGFRLGIQFHEENGHLVSKWQGMQK